MSTKDSKTTQPRTIHSFVCCDSFIEFIPQFGWFKTEDRVCLMPYIQCGEKKMRINHCPSCGKYVRDIQLPEDELLSLIS